MSLGAIAIRVVFAFGFLLLMLRASGKRTIAQGTPLDFMAALVLGDLVDDLLWAEVPAATFVVAVGMLLGLHVSIAFAAFRSPAVRRWVQGSPTELVRAGSPVRETMRRERLTEAELMALLREQSFDDVREVERGTLEDSGKPGVCRRTWAKEAQKQDRPRLLRLLNGGER